MPITPTPITPTPITRGFNHVATLTTDCDRHAAFYAEAFGAVVSYRMEARDDHPRMFILDLGGGAALNVFEVPSGEIIGEQRRQGHRGAIDHFALAVDSLTTLEQTRERLIAAGRRRGRHPAAGRRMVAVLPRRRRDGTRGLLLSDGLTARRTVREYLYREVGSRTYVRYPLIMFADLVEELMGLDDAEVTERFRELELRRRRDEAELLALVAVAEARGVYAADGHLTVKGWLRANANWSPAEVNVGPPQGPSA